MSSIYEIARQTRVSIATVSRVFNRRAHVRPEVRDRILAAAQKLGYAPAVAARRDTVAFVLEGLEDLTNRAYEMLLISTVTSELARRNLHCEILPAHELDAVCPALFKAMIVLVYSPAFIARISRLRRLPVVAVASAIPGAGRVDSDHRQGLMLAVEHLARAGHRRVGLLLSTTRGLPGRQRLAGFRAAARRWQLPLDPALIQDGARTGDYFKSAAHLLEKNITALIVCGENYGLRVLHALNVMRQRIPDDLSLVTCEIPSYSQFLNPPHTTIAQDFQGLAKQAVDQVQALPKRRSGRPETVLVPYRLIERDSVRALPAPERPGP